MSWKSILTASYLRGLLGNTDASQDTYLQQIIHGLVDLLEVETGIDFEFTDQLTTQTIKDPRFALNRKLIQIGAWQSISLVETAVRQPAPVWNTLVIDRDIILKEHRTKPYPFIEVWSGADCDCDSYFCHNSIFRITGIQGFGLSTDVPDALLNIFLAITQSGYNYKKSNNKAVTREKSRSLERQYDTQSNVLESIQLFAPDQIPAIASVISKYKVYKEFPFF